MLIFGGSFDPPTQAHCELPALAAEQLGASRLIYVPAAVSPHKTASPPASPAHRLEMLRLSVLEGAEIDTQELDREGVSYMIDTLESLRADISSRIAMRLLIGTDQAVAFHRWHRWQDILAIAQPVVMRRGSQDIELLLRDIDLAQGSGQGDRWREWLLDLPQMPQSSTAARDQVAASSKASHDVPPLVADYIAANGLYKS
ncbi:MAG: nicotinate (nicotinamide) nucleotide adenylyltransferase [Phycisphaerales bacterium]|nr:nicotinate (nicotinamide) nucleotide adenylyltransferase [Phycisphaerales bacterium]